MKRTKLYAYSSVKSNTLVNITKMKFLQSLLPSEVDFARRFLLVSQHNLPEIEPFYCNLNEEQTRLIKQKISCFEKDIKGTYIPIYFDLPTIDKDGVIQGLVILKMYVND